MLHLHRLAFDIMEYTAQARPITMATRPLKVTDSNHFLTYIYSQNARHVGKLYEAWHAEVVLTYMSHSRAPRARVRLTGKMKKEKKGTLICNSNVTFCLL